MGADLYIKSVHDRWARDWKPRFDTVAAARDNYALRAFGDVYSDARWSDPEWLELQAKVNDTFDEKFTLPVEEVGYYHDGYSPGCLAHFLGFSWWGDIVPLATRGVIPRSKLPKFRQFIAAEPRWTIADWAKDAGVPLRPEGGADPNSSTAREWAEDFMARQRRLIDFIDFAIGLGEPIEASL